MERSLAIIDRRLDSAFSLLGAECPHASSSEHKSNVLIDQVKELLAQVSSHNAAKEVGLDSLRATELRLFSFNSEVARIADEFSCVLLGYNRKLQGPTL